MSVFGATGAGDDQDAQIKAFFDSDLGPENEEDLDNFLSASSDF